MQHIVKNRQYFKFSLYGFLKNLRFFEAFLILFLVEKGLSYTQIGILYAVRQILINVFEIPSGIVADTYGRKNALVGSFVIYILSFLGFYLSNNFWFFLVAFVLFGTADAFRTGTHKGMIMDYLKLNRWEDQKIDYYGHTRSWSQKGSALSALAAGLIVFYSGSYQNIFLFTLIPYLLNLLLILSYPRELNHSPEQLRRQEASGLWQNTLSLYRVIKKPNVLQIINTSALHTAYLSAVKDYIQPLMVNVALLLPLMLQVEPKKKTGIIIGVIYFFIYLATSRASLLAQTFADKHKPYISFLTLLFGFLLGILTGLFDLFNLYTLSLIAFIGIYLVENVRKPILTGFISDNVPNNILTSVISAQSLLKTIITAALAFVFGFIADQVNIGFSFVVVSGFLVLMTMGINFYSRRKIH